MATQKKAEKAKAVWAVQRVKPMCPSCGAVLPRPGGTVFGPVEATCACGVVCQAVFTVQQGA